MLRPGLDTIHKLKAKKSEILVPPLDAEAPSTIRVVRLRRKVCANNKDKVVAINRCELDSHADTCVAGANTLLIAHDNRLVSVHPFSSDYAPMKDVIIGSVATLWEDPMTGQPYNLIIHEALYLGKTLPDTLLTPNQLRANGLTVEEAPKQFDPMSSHSICSKDLKLRIPMNLDGVISGFESRKPTWEEFELHPKIELTSSIKWKPYSKRFATEELRQVSSLRQLLHSQTACPDNHFRQVAAARAYHESQDLIEFDDDLFKTLSQTVHAASDDLEGDGRQGHVDDDVYPKTDEHRRLFSLKTGEQ